MVDMAKIRIKSEISTSDVIYMLVRTRLLSLNKAWLFYTIAIQSPSGHKWKHTFSHHQEYQSCEVCRLKRRSSILFYSWFQVFINAEFSLQSVSQNSHKNNQHQSWSQICELCESFIISCCWTCYAQVISFHPYFHHLLAIKALR